MNNATTPRLGQYTIILLLMIIVLSATVRANIITPSLARNDPFPIYTADYPYAFLLTQTQNYLKQWSDDDCARHFGFAISPFYQSSCYGHDIHKQLAPLGDLVGRWNLIGLTYGNIPNCQCNELLQEIGNETFCEIIGCDGEKLYPQPNINDPSVSDPEQLLGFLSAPLEYRKAGIRGSLTFTITRSLEFVLEAGVADIAQDLVGTECTPFTCIQNAPSSEGACTISNIDCCDTPLGCFQGKRSEDNPKKVSVIAPGFIDHTFEAFVYSDPGTPTGAIYGTEDITQVRSLVTDQALAIFKSIGLDVSDYHKLGIEDVRVAFIWRRPFPVNECLTEQDYAYEKFLFIPHVALNATFATTPANCTLYPNKAFAAPLGNSGHHAIGATAGFGFDFYNTIQIGFAANGTHYFTQDLCNVPVPTSELQSTIFPFRTDVRWSPGPSFVLSASMNAYHFIDQLSFYAEYIYLDHLKDTIKVLGSNAGTDPSINPSYEDNTVTCVFLPKVLEVNTPFTAQLFNLGFLYDISPNAAIGFLLQASITETNAYHLRTYLFSFECTF